MTDEALPPGSVIGILGGGQLGRMLAIAAARLGLRAHVFEPAADPPAGEVAAALTRAAYDDLDALARFADAVDVVTFEFENVPAASAETLMAHAPVRPHPRALAIAQDRAEEKAFLNGLGLATAPWRAVADLAELEAALEAIGTPAILKTRRLGYDGKGQAVLDAPGRAGPAWRGIDGAPAVLEGMVAFRRELSVIGARSAAGRVVCYAPGENVHAGGILRTTTVPASSTRLVRDEARRIAAAILEALDYVGVMGVELFETGDGALLVNEIAPRVHNSGHWTIEACVVDQFQNHVRAVAGWPLGDGARHSDAVMTNLIGDEADRWRELAASGDALHLYGKRAARPGRKMGHVTRLTPRRG